MPTGSLHAGMSPPTVVRMSATDRSATSPGGQPLAVLALATGVLPFLTAQLCYVISAQAGYIPACVPYLEGCTSVSASGRHGRAFFIYKAGMIPSAVLLAAYWVLAAHWLRALGGQRTVAMRAMVALGMTSAAFYVLYAIFVGSPPDDTYVLLRRLGAAVHLSFAGFAQVLLTRELLRLPAREQVPAYLRHSMVAVVGSLLGLALLLVPIDELGFDKDRAENVIEWNYCALMVFFYVLSARAWHATGFRIDLTIGPAGRESRDRD